VDKLPTLPDKLYGSLNILPGINSRIEIDALKLIKALKIMYTYVAFDNTIKLRFTISLYRHPLMGCRGFIWLARFKLLNSRSKRLAFFS
jgi:hypothetical protein